MQHTGALTRQPLDLSWSWNHSADAIWKELDPELWELYAEPQPGTPALRTEMPRTASASEAPGAHRYSIRTQATRAAGDFTPRILPHHALALGTEICRVVWQE